MIMPCDKIKEACQYSPTTGNVSSQKCALKVCLFLDTQMCHMGCQWVILKLRQFWQRLLCICTVFSLWDVDVLICSVPYKTIILHQRVLFPASLVWHTSSGFSQSTYTVNWKSMWRRWRLWRSCVSRRGRVSSQQGFWGRAKLRGKSSPFWMLTVRIYHTKFTLFII